MVQTLDGAIQKPDCAIEYDRMIQETAFQEAKRCRKRASCDSGNCPMRGVGGRGGWEGEGKVRESFHGKDAFRNFVISESAVSRIRGFQFPESAVFESVFSSFPTLLSMFPESFFWWFRIRTFSISESAADRQMLDSKVPEC